MSLSKKIWTILAITMLASTFLLVQTPNVYAEQETVKEKVLNAMRDVAGIDVDKYTVTVYNYRSGPIPEFEKNYKGEEEIYLTLKSAESQIGVLAECVNNHILCMNIYIESGSSSTVHYVNKLSGDSLAATREVLYRLQKFTGNSVISDMSKIMESVKNVEDIAGKTFGNIKCVVFTDPYNVNSNGVHPVNSIYFMDSSNGAESPRSIGFHFNDDFFKGFHDAWDLYSVSGADVKVSREQAIAIAREQAIVAAESAPLEFPSDRPVIAELHMISRGETFMLYPFWFVEVPLVYSSDLTINAWQTGVWADTGEIEYGHPVGGYGVMPDTNNPESPSPNHDKLLIAGITTTVAIVSLIAFVVLKKR
jgi:hypothetical protein